MGSHGTNQQGVQERGRRWIQPSRDPHSAVNDGVLEASAERHVDRHGVHATLSDRESATACARSDSDVALVRRRLSDRTVAHTVERGSGEDQTMHRV